MATTIAAAARLPPQWPVIPISRCRPASFKACPWVFRFSDRPGASRCYSSWLTASSRPSKQGGRRDSWRQQICGRHEIHFSQRRRVRGELLRLHFLIFSPFSASLREKFFARFLFTLPFFITNLTLLTALIS